MGQKLGSDVGVVVEAVEGAHYELTKSDRGV